MKQIVTEQAFTSYMQQRWVPFLLTGGTVAVQLQMVRVAFAYLSLWSHGRAWHHQLPHVGRQEIVALMLPNQVPCFCRQGEIEESLRAVFGLADIAQREHITIEQTEVDQGVSRVAAEGMEITDEVTDNVAQTLLVSLLIVCAASHTA